MNDRLREALRRKIQRHNKVLRLYAVWSSFLVTCMWFAMYFVARWAVIFFRTVTQGVDAEAPAHFVPGYLVFVAAWLVAGWVEQKREPVYLRSNDRTFLELFLELALFPPRATFSIVRNLREQVSLNEGELGLASELLERIGRAGKLPVDDVPQFFAEEVDHERLVEILQKLDLVNLREVKGVEFYAVTDPQRLAAFL